MKTLLTKTTLMLTPENLKQLKYQSADEGKPVSEILNMILTEYYSKR